MAGWENVGRGTAIESRATRNSDGDQRIVTWSVASDRDSYSNGYGQSNSDDGKDGDSAGGSDGDRNSNGPSKGACAHEPRYVCIRPVHRRVYRHAYRHA